LFLKVNVMDYNKTVTRSKYGIGGVAEVQAVVSFHLDVDAGKDDRYLTPSKMLQAIHSMPLAPSMIVQTNGDGGGFHAYWLLSEPHYIFDDEDRQRCQHIAIRWLAELREFAKPGTIDGTANLDRILRPVGSKRSSGNTVRFHTFEPDRRYLLSQFELPSIAQPAPTFHHSPVSDDDKVISRYLTARGLDSVESILSLQGYSQFCRDFWIRPGSASGSPTGQVYVVDGKPGFTVKSGAADPLSCENARGGTGNWYSLESLFVSFHTNCDASNGRNPQAWRVTARFCHEYFDRSAPSANTKGVEKQRPSSSDQSDEPPAIKVTFNESHVTSKVLACMARLGKDADWLPRRVSNASRLFVRNGRLVQTVPSEDPISQGSLQIKDVPVAIVRERITQACFLYYEKEDKDGNIVQVPQRPEKWLVDAIFHRGHYDGLIDPITGIIQSPTIRRDGSILQEPGYDKQTGLLYRPNANFEQVPERPTQDDARRAFEALCEVVKDFPFVDESDRSAWLSLVLTMIARESIAGSTLLFGITATCPGSGKGLLVDAAGLIAYGRLVSKRELQGREQDLSDFITTVIYEGTPCHVFDNVTKLIGSESLDAVITSGVRSDRLKGETRSTGEMPARTIWVATGNNLQFGTDLHRRVLLIRLAPSIENPEERSDFEHKNLLAWIRQNRTRLVSAALTILRAYHAAGKPYDGVTLGNFEDWCLAIRGAVMFAGGDDPLLTRADVKGEDDSREFIGRVIDALEQIDPERKGLTVREMEQIIKQYPEQCQPLVDVIGEVCQGPFNAKRFTSRLRSIEGRIVGGKRIEKRNAAARYKKWSVGLVNTDPNSLANSLPNSPSNSPSNSLPLLEGVAEDNEASIDYDKFIKNSRSKVSLNSPVTPNSPLTHCQTHSPKTPKTLKKKGVAESEVSLVSSEVVYTHEGSEENFHIAPPPRKVDSNSPNSLLGPETPPEAAPESGWKSEAAL
jgi:hypothetical protein